MTACKNTNTFKNKNAKEKPYETALFKIKLLKTPPMSCPKQKSLGHKPPLYFERMHTN